MSLQPFVVGAASGLPSATTFTGSCTTTSRCSFTGTMYSPSFLIGSRNPILRLSIDYLGPGRIGDWLQAEGEVVGHDEHVVQVRGRLYGRRHDVLAGLGVFSLLSRHRQL